MVTGSHLQHDKRTEWSNSSKLNYHTPPSLPFCIQCFLENHASIIACFLSLRTAFLVLVYINFFWPHSSWDCIAYKLIKYNQLQFSENKPDETTYVML